MLESLNIIQKQRTIDTVIRIIILLGLNSFIYFLSESKPPSNDAYFIGVLILAMFNLWYLRSRE